MTQWLPDEFKCPISLEIMTDPVILSSGHTFDRVSIQRWLDSGNRSCPITKQPLSKNFSLIPNHVLRSLISQFTLGSNVKPQLNHPEPQTLISVISSESLSPSLKIDSLSQLNRLCKRNPVLRQSFMESGAGPSVLNCIDSVDLGLRESALMLLLSLSLDDDNKVGLVTEGAIGHIVEALRGGSSSCRSYAATILTSLAMVEVNKATIGAYPLAIQRLSSLLRDGKAREKKEAATALYALCSFPDNRKRAVRCGAVPILIEMAVSGVERAIEVLGLLAKCREGREEMGRFDGCVVSVLVQVLRNESSRSVVHALSALHSLCNNSEEMGLSVVRQGGLELCLGFVEDENEKVSRNASNLVQVLRKYWVN